MKNHISAIIATMFILFTFNPYNTNAQCSFNLNPEVVQEAVCISAGQIRVTLVGDDFNPSNIYISVSDNRLINEQSSENGHLFTALPAGTYSILAQAYCANSTNPVEKRATVTIKSEYTELKVALGPASRSSLNCINSGMTQIMFWDGSPPYKVEITEKPDEYTGETVFNFDWATTVQFNEFAPGEYIFTVSDQCSYKIPIPVTINKLGSDFPEDPYLNFSFLGCNVGTANMNSAETHEYWISWEYRDYYEVAFTLDEPTEWFSLTDYNAQNPTLPESYRTLYNSGAKMKAYLRLKGTECQQLVDELGFDEITPPAEIYSDISRSCSAYQTNFWLNNSALLCSPYKWEITDDATGDLVASMEDLEYFYTQSVEDLEYGKNYTLKVTAADGTEVVRPISNETSYTDMNPDEVYPTNENDEDNYKYDLNYYLHNFYNGITQKWELFTADSVLIKSSEEITESSATIPDLEYSTEYIITITDCAGKIHSFHHTQEPPFRDIEWHLDGFGGSGTDPFSCDDYRIMVTPIHMNNPYTWTLMLMDLDSTIVSSGTSDDVSNMISGLQYNTAYILEITDGISTRHTDITESSMTFPNPHITDYDYINYQCDDYEFYFHVASVYCYPYKWEIFDDAGERVAGGENIDSYQKHSARLKYDMVYTVQITDSKDHEYIILDWLYKDSYDVLTPYFNGWTENDQCNTYDYVFSVERNYCFPYKWEVRDSDDKIIDSDDGFTELGEHRVTLEYNKDYRIIVTSGNGYSNGYPQYSYKDIASVNGNIYKNRSSCYDNDNGYIELYGPFDIGTHIKFESGPQTPVHADIVLEEHTYYFYPFSEDWHWSEYVSIAEGDYVFTVTNQCGSSIELSISYYKDVVSVNFSYTIDETTDLCRGVARLYPQGKVKVYQYDYWNGYWDWYEYDAYFTMIASPDNSSLYMNIMQDEYFSLSKSGEYVIGIKYDYWSCVADTIVINHEHKSFTLEGRSSYVCETGSIGHIRIQATNGVQPYLYTLQNVDGTPVEGVEPNNTGAFEYGANGEKYIVEIKDACPISKSFPVDVQINTLDNIALLSGASDICKGGTIELSCLMLGATSYEWTGPNGFSSTDRNITIPNATTEHNGTYTVKVRPAGCGDKWVSDDVEIRVHDTPMPEIDSDFKLCQAESTTVLSAVSLGEGYSIQWYDSNGDLLPEAPAIDLNSEVKNYVFYVAQTEDDFQCSSEKKKVTVAINPLPEKNATATGWSCQDANPQITVNDIVPGYVYTIFSDADAATDPIMIFQGINGSMTLNMPITVADDTKFYLRTSTSEGCTLSPGIVEFQVDVDRIELSPDKLPVYAHDVPYSVQLTTNAEAPVFSLDGNLITGISLSPEGLISGTVLESAGYQESTFMVIVTDKNSCPVSKEYILKTCARVPEESNVSYCQNATAIPLQVASMEGLSLQWYDADLNKLDEAPIPNTSVVGEQIFYASYRNEEEDCEGGRSEIRVTINPLPEHTFEAPDVNVCSGSYPVINLNNLNSAYTYSIYADAQLTDSLTSVSKTTSGVVMIPTIPETSTVYYITIIDDKTCVSATAKEVKAEVIQLKISPDKLPVYVHDVPYSVQLTTNAETPVFSPAGNLITGISLSSEGLISGTVPESAGYLESTFMVIVTDKNSCQDTKEYILKTCARVPEESNVSYCQNATAIPLQVAPVEGLSLQWYDADLNKLDEAPIPNTSVVGEQIFYASYRNEEEDCEGGRSEIRVTINPLPEHTFDAPDVNVCSGSYPVINLSNLNSAYTYSIYADAQLTDPLIPVTKTTSDVVIIPTIPETSTVYYITIIDDKTCVSATAKEVKAEVIQLKISPDKLPVYAHDVPYSVQLTTNAETPVFSPAGNLITGISMSSEGLISGTVPESVGHEQFHFTVTVTDKNSCQDTKDYILKTCARVPEESNVSYCQNATASPLPTSSAEGFPLQWYDADLNKLDEAPTPNTSVVGEQIFYVSHINEQEDCESGRSEIRVTINPLPEHTFDAPDVNVCSGSYPVINLSNLNSAYTYSIYADAQLTDLLTPVSETTSGVVMIPTIPETSTVYYITTTDDKTCVSSTAKAVKAEVIQLEILPDKLPIYIHDVPYSVQLTTNAESPVFTTDNFVEGITLSSSGLISGVIPASVGHDKLPFIVTVTDQNLCRTSNKYVIHSCSALPETSELLISYCKGTTAVPLEASSAEGFPLQWYDENFTKLTEAPIPNTSLVGEQKFYVSQINEAEQCESGHTEIRVTITALPENTFDAPAVNVCFGSSPVISLSNLNSLYSYAIYADAQLTDRLASTTGKTSDEVTLPTVPATSTEYYIQMADDLGCVAETPVEVKTTVISLEILPERLPVFKTDVPYSVQLTSNAESPTYSYTGDLVTGITMTSEGLISGMVSESSLDEQSVFSVTVNDVNGCLATRGYTLISCVSPPQFSDQTVYCESVPAEALQAVSVEGNSLQWYDAELNQLGTAPVPNTSIVGEQRFYVTQIDATKGCESEMTEVLITVNPAPSIEFADSIAPVCFGGSPVVKLNNLREDYTYSVYSDNEMSYERGSLTGVNSGQILIDDILESDTTYYIRVKDVLGCPSTDRTTIPVTVVKLYIQPDTLPSYAIRKPYEQILLSNAERAMFSVSEGSVPAGLMLDVSGRISGEVSSSIYGDDNTFTVEVRDRNGCTAHQRYTLVGGIYIPEIFTPNGDGINDVFMPENKVVIFDRLGIEMYRGNHGWDGTHKGKFVAEDIYFFILEYIDPFGKTVQVQGYVGVLY